MHGGAGKLAENKAKERLKKMLPAALQRLEQLRDQGDHLPTSMMAVKEILTRTLGPTQGAGQGGSSGPVINIGFLSKSPDDVSVEVIDTSPEPVEESEE